MPNATPFDTLFSLPPEQQIHTICNALEAHSITCWDEPQAQQFYQAAGKLLREQNRNADLETLERILESGKPGYLR